MQILATADLHGDHDIYKWLVVVAVNTKPDVLVMAGDLLVASDVSGTIEEAQRANASETLKIISLINQYI